MRRTVGRWRSRESRTRPRIVDPDYLSRDFEHDEIIIILLLWLDATYARGHWAAIGDYTYMYFICAVFLNSVWWIYVCVILILGLIVCITGLLTGTALFLGVSPREPLLNTLSRCSNTNC